MARFSDIQKGKRARRVVAFPMPNTRCPLLAPLPELEAARAATESGGAASVAPDDEPHLVALVVLTDEEDGHVDELARAAAIKAGVADPKPNEPIYDRAVMVHTLLLGCVDPDSPDNAPVPFFSSVDQIRKNMSSEQIVHLFVQHEHWQDEVSPRDKHGSPEAFYQWLAGVAESESPSDFFELVGRATLWRYVRTLINLLGLSQTDKSAPGGSAETSGSPSTTPTVKTTEPTEGPSGG